MQRAALLNVTTVLWKLGTVRQMTQTAELGKGKEVYYECSNYCLKVKRASSTTTKAQPTSQTINHRTRKNTCIDFAD